MVPILSLWMPIVLAAVLVFVMSSLIHMALKYHNADYEQAPNEDAIMQALRDAGITPGDYVLPSPKSHSGFDDPELLKKWEEGPPTMMTVFPSGAPNMVPQLVQWFAYSVLVGAISAYVAGRALPPGAEYLDVFRFAGTTAFCCYSMALIQNSIWYRKNWGATLRSVFDGLVYASLTAGAFGWLWPAV